jgi:hypothetical protein
MSRSVRFIVRGVHGRVRMNHNWNAIKSHASVVQISAAEIKPATLQPLPAPGAPAQNFIYNLGDANVWVSNVSPHAGDHFVGEPGGVEFILNVDFPSPLNVAVTITVEDSFPEAIESL